MIQNIVKNVTIVVTHLTIIVFGPIVALGKEITKAF
jgi:hypothetical protein